MNTVSPLSFLVAAFLVSCSHGLETSLQAESSGKGCQLYCKVSTPIIFGQRQDTDDSGMSTITSVGSFKLLKNVLNKDGTGGVLLATVSLDKAKVQIETDKMIIKGSIDFEETTFQASINDEDDCKHKYSCQAEGWDFEGGETMSTKTFARQSTAENMDGEELPENMGEDVQDDEGALSSGITMQLLTLIQQLDKNVAVLTKAMEGLEDKIGFLEKAVGYEIKSVEFHLSDKFNSVEDKLNGLETHTVTGKGTATKSGENVCNLEVTVSNGGAKVGGSDISDRLVEMKKELEAYRNSTVDSAGSDTFSNSDLMDLVMNSTNTLLASIENSLPSPSPQAADSVGELLANLTQTVADAIASRTTYEVPPPKNDTCQPSHEFLESIKFLDVSFSNSTAETQSAINDLFSTVNITIDSTVRSLVDDIVAPKVCKKGMVPAVGHSPFPYPLITASDSSELDYTVLCDAVTVEAAGSSSSADLTERKTSTATGMATKTASAPTTASSGNDRIHALTTSDKYELRIDVQYYFESQYAVYKNFSILGEDAKYKLLIGEHNGNSPDMMKIHNQKPFSTKDKDNDETTQTHCAEKNGGGWWFYRCDTSNLNGHWGGSDDLGVEWTSLAGKNSCTFTEMKIRKLSKPSS
ncbi:fibrinogen-related protein 2.1 [Elysia marginata]|uniref:Fibrinogen-related protein 2.1 n=1 Tax=Elysia marginata TaxID=1093978 RepID=A0AAV4I2A5_9GAST|nr:fibrinogen-related protein 2.1 [Elysia marginata]